MDIVVWLIGIVLGSVFGFFIKEGLEAFEASREERKNSIRGMYTTLTEGSVFRGPQERAPADGKIERQLILTQRGRCISGIETSEDEADVRWEVTGEINGEYIVGTYWQKTPPSLIDRGAFHLERDPHDHHTYRGLWVGWHPEKRELTSGEYRWKRDV